MADASENPIAPAPAPEPEYCAPELVDLGTLRELTQSGPNLTSTDGVEGHS